MNAIADINIRLILEVEAGKRPGLSTSQEIMVGLALCRPRMLKSAGYPDPRGAWNRLDGGQRKAAQRHLTAKKLKLPQRRNTLWIR